MADFAKAQLLKYGWTEGKGLGKNETGITQAVKPRLKFDTTGLGHSNNYTNQWWDNCYERALKSIALQSEAENQSQNRRRKPKEIKVFYGRFLCSNSIVQNGVQIDTKQKSYSSEDESPATVPTLTDEELFKACGGRTAHKGARHGLKLSGKLRRIAEQEKAFLETSTLSLEKLEIDKSKCKRKNKPENDNGDSSKKMRCDPEVHDEATVVEPLMLNSCYTRSSPHYKRSKLGRRKDRRRINDLTHKFDSICKIQEPVVLMVEEPNQEEVVKSSFRKEEDKKRSLGSAEPGTSARKMRVEPPQEEEEEKQGKGATKDQTLEDSGESGFHEEMERLFTELKEDVKEKAGKLNSRITRKKYKKIRRNLRREKAKLELISQGLMAVRLNNEGEKGAKEVKEEKIGNREGPKETKKLENIVKDMKAVNLEEVEQEQDNEGESIVKFVKAPSKKSSKSSKDEPRKVMKAK